MISDTEKTLNIASSIESQIDVSLFPDVSSPWDWGQLYCIPLLFGEYVARVFYEINAKQGIPNGYL